MRYRYDPHLHIRMSLRTTRIIVVFIVAAHIGLALAYTLPRRFVPDRLFYWSQYYMRPLFHQQWNLFAPDPALCQCGLEVGFPDGSWRSIELDEDHYLILRMSRPLADHVHDQVDRGDTVVMPVLAAAMRGLVRNIGRETPGLRYRLVEQCVTDPERPLERVTRITPLQLPDHEH